MAQLHARFLCIRPKNTSYFTDTGSAMSTAALFIITKKWKQPKCPSTNEWVIKVYIYTMGYLFRLIIPPRAKGKKNVMNSAGKLMKLEMISLS